MKKVVCFVGRHNSGKTTVISRLIPLLKAEGIEAAVIKHAHHALKIQDTEDSGRIFAAGAAAMIAVSPDLTIQYQRQPEPELEKLIEGLPEHIDLVIVEGYKSSSYPKIEVLRKETGPESFKLEQTIAYVSDFPIETSLPVFQIDEVRKLSESILNYLNK